MAVWELVPGLGAVGAVFASGVVSGHQVSGTGTGGLGELWDVAEAGILALRRSAGPSRLPLPLAPHLTLTPELTATCHPASSLC